MGRSCTVSVGCCWGKRRVANRAGSGNDGFPAVSWSDAANALDACKCNGIKFCPIPGEASDCTKAGGSCCSGCC